MHSGLMYLERRSKLDDKAVPCYFLNAGDNHADCCVKVLRDEKRRVCYSSNVTWAPLPQSGGGGVQYCPFRARTAHAAGGVIRDCLDAAHRCRSAARALTQRPHLATDRTVWYAARRCRSATRALTQRSHPSLEAACHCGYSACSSHLAATIAAIVITAAGAFTQRSHLAAARTGCYAARRCRSAARALAQRSHTACRMFADAGVVSLFRQGRRLDDIVIAITSGDTGPADV